jgi:hypothetical protein
LFKLFPEQLQNFLLIELNPNWGRSLVTITDKDELKEQEKRWQSHLFSNDETIEELQFQVEKSEADYPINVQTKQTLDAMESMTSAPRYDRCNFLILMVCARFKRSLNELTIARLFDPLGKLQFDLNELLAQWPILKEGE